MFEKKAAYPVTEPRRVAFIGLGVMGYPMAGHLLAAGHSVTVYNRTTAKADKWVKEFGGSRALTPKEAASGADVVFACVGNDDDLRSVILGENGAPGGMQAGAGFGVNHDGFGRCCPRDGYAFQVKRPALYRCARLRRSGRCRKRDSHRDVRGRHVGF